MQQFTPILHRLAAASVLCVAFIAMASIIRPKISDAAKDKPTASENARSARPQGSPGQADARGLKSLGELTDGEYTVRMFAGEPILYTVIGPEGDMLGELITRERLQEEFTFFVIDDLLADERPELMLMESGGDDATGWPD